MLSRSDGLEALMELHFSRFGDDPAKITLAIGSLVAANGNALASISTSAWDVAIPIWPEK
tara:strand:- start:360 stop:539 length:180 start_codon:yes stop_codon:yes gene_type:complete